tara:strand:- start:51 stop:206 length:156 start_codon:yes stop_codon:yes gene_type:complete
MKVSRNKAIQILADHGEVPEHHQGREEQGFYSECGIKETYTVKQIRDYLGY